MSSSIHESFSMLQFEEFEILKKTYEDNNNLSMEFELIGMLVRIQDKTNMLKLLLNKQKSITNTATEYLIDIMNYSVLASIPSSSTEFTKNFTSQQEEFLKVVSVMTETQLKPDTYLSQLLDANRTFMKIFTVASNGIMYVGSELDKTILRMALTNMHVYAGLLVLEIRKAKTTSSTELD
jgi:hypothetical protein